MPSSDTAIQLLYKLVSAVQGSKPNIIDDTMAEVMGFLHQVEIENETHLTEE